MRKRAKALVATSAARWISMGMAQICTFAVCGVAAFALRFDFGIPRNYYHYLIVAIPVWIVVKSLAFHIANLDRRGYRYVSVLDAYRLLWANIAASAVSVPMIIAIAGNGFPRSIYLIDLIISISASAGLRIAVRLVAESAQSGKVTGNEKRIFIYGAGDGGAALLREIRKNSRLPYDVCGFIDDRPDKKGVLIDGVPVRGDGSTISSLVANIRLRPS